jgi:signal transduction histidine kinase
LRPLDQLRAQIGSLQENASGQRIGLPQQPAELKPVTEELNRLLNRVENALARERMLTTNVAHELRTPIAGLLSTLEVTLNRLRSPKEYRESAVECLEIAKRMNWLVTNLLSITRIEAGNVQLQKREVHIEDAFTEWWRPFETRADEQRLQMNWQITPHASVETDPEYFRVVVTNLFDNAVSYAPEGGTIQIEAGADGMISVANQAAGLNSEGIAHVFDPFWRNTPSWDGKVDHAGLGLSLCKKIMELLGGRISAHIQQPDNLFVVRLEMPDRVCAGFNGAADLPERSEGWIEGNAQLR